LIFGLNFFFLSHARVVKVTGIFLDQFFGTIFTPNFEKKNLFENKKSAQKIGVKKVVPKMTHSMEHWKNSFKKSKF